MSRIDSVEDTAVGAMFPIVLDLARVAVVIVGDGARTAKRVAQLRDAGARDIAVYSAAPGAALISAAGGDLVRRHPAAVDLARAGVVFIVDLPEAEAAQLAATARAVGVLVNVEDRRPHCDFHTPSIVKRGDLTISISTNGRSPTLARRMREFLEKTFGAEWRARLDVIDEKRRQWRAAGADQKTVKRLTDELIDRNSWL